MLAPLVLGHERHDITPTAGAVRERVAAALEEGVRRIGEALAEIKPREGLPV